MYLITFLLMVQDGTTVPRMWILSYLDTGRWWVTYPGPMATAVIGWKWKHTHRTKNNPTDVNMPHMINQTREGIWGRKIEQKVTLTQLQIEKLLELYRSPEFRYFFETVIAMLDEAHRHDSWFSGVPSSTKYVDMIPPFREQRVASGSERRAGSEV